MDPEIIAEIRRLTAREDEGLATARARAGDAVPVPAPEVGAILAWAAATVAARHVVEIGCAAGLTGLWLLRGMAHRGILTSIERDPHLHGLASTAFEQAAVADRVRSILGEPSEVLERLSDGTYDLCLVQGRLTDHGEHLGHALRLLRPGGVLVTRGMLHPPDTARGTPLRSFADLLADDDRLTGAVLPVDDGLGVATIRPDP